jgi:aspartyl-tRNA(Asn)/glutamyl-tRNA(Gln) amidotransferase subunit B
MANELEVIIGLEVHAQMNTKTKMFCACDNDAWGKPPNTTVCPVCMGHPGTLPVPNRAVIDKAIRASKALKCTVNEKSHFDRKNYFYPDLPTGFQISQYKHPLSSHGEVRYSIQEANGNSGTPMVCRIHRLHIENDAGKLQHRANGSLCDYNRAGTPLMEIVTEPDLHSPFEASAFAEELRRILIAANTSEADMYKGMMRFDASISLRPKGDSKLYPRVEIKNLNSFKALEKALAYQEKVLRKLWAEGKQPTGETTVGRSRHVQRHDAFRRVYFLATKGRQQTVSARGNQKPELIQGTGKSTRLPRESTAQVVGRGQAAHRRNHRGLDR